MEGVGVGEGGVGVGGGGVGVGGGGGAEVAEGTASTMFLGMLCHPPPQRED